MIYGAYTLLSIFSYIDSTDSKIAIAVATTISGFALIILCIFISIVLYGFFVHYRKKMSRRKEEEYNLMDENTDSENTDSDYVKF